MQHYPLVTIVGGSGFVGRHTVKALAAAGYRIRVLVRDSVAAEFLKTAATVGQIAIEHVDMTRPETLAGKFAGSDAVINLVSIAYESGRQKFGAINVEGARIVAEEAAKAGAARFIQMSGLGVDRATTTKYGTTKLAGEDAVRKAFPGATVLRPSVIVGPEDKFFQRFARMSMLAPALPLIGGGHTKFQPVLVTDVAAAILACLKQPDTAGKTYELGGPKTYSFRELLELLARIINRRPRLINLPRPLASLQAFFFELIFCITRCTAPIRFTPPLTRDQVRLLAHDNVVNAGALTFRDLGMEAGAIEDVLPAQLARYVKA